MHEAIEESTKGRGLAKRIGKKRRRDDVRFAISIRQLPVMIQTMSSWSSLRGVEEMVMEGLFGKERASRRSRHFLGYVTCSVLGRGRAGSKKAQATDRPGQVLLALILGLQAGSQ